MIHWRPSSGFVGDVIPFSHAGRIWLFYLLDERPEDSFGAPPGYVPQDWRDPFVYRTAADQPWQMVLAARYVDVPDRRCGVVARLTSVDLRQWTIAEPLWEPHRYITQECPDVFQWGDWWYLVYSEFTDAFQTRYRIARGPDGPWLAPGRDTVDGRAFYAAKSVEHEGRRFFIGWIPTKQGDSDAGRWQWAGDLAVLEAHQEDDGTRTWPDRRRTTGPRSFAVATAVSCGRRW